MKKTIGVFAMSAILSLSMLTTSFADPFVKSDKAVKGSDTKGYYATGYVQSEARHYANIRLLERATDKIVRESGRKYGYDKVTVTTSKTTSYASKAKLTSKIYYGWK